MAPPTSPGANGAIVSEWGNVLRGGKLVFKNLISHFF